MAERVPVKDEVAGSNPAAGAELLILEPCDIQGYLNSIIY